MLQTHQTDPSINLGTPPSEFRSLAESLAEGVAFIRRHLSIMLLTCAISAGAALLYLVTVVPTFTADAQVVVDSKAARGDGASVSTIVESQIAILKSEGIARAVITKLALARDPELSGSNGILRSLKRSIYRLLGWSKPETEASAMQYAVESFERKLTAKRAGLTYIVDLTFDSKDPERAAQILNTVIETYVASQMDSKFKSALGSEKWVKDRLDELSAQASAAQKAVANYRKNRSDSAASTEPGDAGSSTSPGELRVLEAAAETATRNHDNFVRMLRYMEAQQQSQPVLESHVLTDASPPLRASSPNIAIVLGISAAAGVFLGLAFGMLRDLSHRGTIRTGAEVWNEFQIACIAVVPAIESLAGRLAAFAHRPARTERALPNARSRSIARTDNPIWTVTDAPQSRFTGSLLEIKLAIDGMNRSGKRNQVIGLTSAQPDEGKSTVAAALALFMARSGAKVVLLDCNLRSRSLSAALAPTAERGLLDVLSGAATLREIAWIEPATQLAFLPIGNSARPICDSEIVASERLDGLFRSLRETYEYVIVDLPAVTPFADVQAAVSALDSLIFVVEAGRTNIDLIKRGLDVVRHENVVGIVLNKAKHDGVLAAFGRR
ncbi:Wzz/FepE/Etk N-terminal domain-containing protein [Bradyrhizobium sp. UFLA05-109]